MPPARSASARTPVARTSTARTSAARAAAAAERRRARAQGRRQPQPVKLRAPHLRVRWERVGRIGLLLVLAIVIGLYAEHAISYLSARAASNRQHAIVSHLERQNAYFERRQRSLENLPAILAQARRLGMVRPGEQPYAIIGKRGR
ncbi:MAG TPA: septum formation initiator family protein [Solirubrobacteraceae bacterium]|nr:septum formation initiator family protein [Solirubrobacteraceae bacterium]